MRDYKTSMIVMLSLLILISAGLLFTVFYNFHYQNTVEVPVVKQVRKDSAATVESSHDSLLKIYTATISGLDKDFDATLHNADSLKTMLDSSLNEFYKLRNEIKAVIKDSGSIADLGMARQKIIELQERIAALRYINSDVERENKRLNALLNRLTGNGKARNQNPLNDEIDKRPPIKKISDRDIFLLYDLRFSAIQMNNGKEQETNKAGQTEKLSGYFKVKNKNIQSSDAEIMIVVLQPDGKILQNPHWDAGTFETAEGKKIYSAKLRFEYSQGEAKQLRFSLTADKYQQGNYTLKIYHYGTLIGKMVKILS